MFVDQFLKKDRCIFLGVDRPEGKADFVEHGRHELGFGVFFGELTVVGDRLAILLGLVERFRPQECGFFGSRRLGVGEVAGQNIKCSFVIATGGLGASLIDEFTGLLGHAFVGNSLIFLELFDQLKLSVFKFDNPLFELVDLILLGFLGLSPFGLGAF